MSCEFCDNQKSKDLRFKIKEYDYWTIFLWQYPYYLGRCFVRLNRHAEDFFEITEEEREELFEIVPKLKDAIEELFGADMMNYASLGNIVRHVHLHVIPRYAKNIFFENIEFCDERWGKNYTPYSKEFDVSEGVKKAIAGKISAALER